MLTLKLPSSENLMPMLLFIPTAPKYIKHVPFKEGLCCCKPYSQCLVALCLCLCGVLIIDRYLSIHCFLVISHGCSFSVAIGKIVINGFCCAPICS